MIAIIICNAYLPFAPAAVPYASRRDPNGVWSAARNVAAVTIQTARLSPDGEVLFFQRIENKREQIYWVRLQSVMP